MLSRLNPWADVKKGPEKSGPSEEVWQEPRG
jgi:hypothetical protein